MAASSQQGEAPATAAAGAGRSRASSRRGVLLRDGLLLLILCSVSIALFGVTLFLFKSFEAHRDDLGRRWSERGRLALAQGRPAEAAGALRTALSYAPDDRTDQLLLAQALAAAGHTEAATNYFLNLWDTRPGDGFVNLQLARLAKARGAEPEAVNYYHASIFGNWDGDGVARRRQVRLELVDYLVQRGRTSAARTELLIAAGNAPETDTPVQLQLADRLASLGDLPDALQHDAIAAAHDPHDRMPLEKAGRTAFALGEYPEAYRFLAGALAAARRRPVESQGDAELMTMLTEARRAPELVLSRDLSPGVRAEHLVFASTLAQERLHACAAERGAAAKTSVRQGVVAPPPEPLVPLETQWAAQSRALTRTALERDPTREDSITALVNETERQTAALCGAPTGDDAVLLLLANRPSGGTP